MSHDERPPRHDYNENHLLPSSDSAVYVLRVWRETGDGGGWRFVLQDVATGGRRGFASLALLLHFLSSALGPQEPLSDDDIYLYFAKGEKKC